MTVEVDASAVLHVAVGLLRMVGGTDADASHLAAAVSRHRRDMRLEGSAVPASLDALEKVFARVAVGPRRSTEDHRGSDVGDVPARRDSGIAADQLTRGQAAKRLRCSVSTLKRRESEGELLPVRHGRIVRYRVSDIDDYLKRNHAC